jgi:steroid delta-isomerase-like uncharacterized protein
MVSHTKKKGEYTMSEENKAIHRRIWEEIWNQKNLDVADEIYDSSHISNGQGIELPPGPKGLKKLISIYRDAFPDVHFTIEDQIAEGDKVVTRWTSRGTHKGELMGIPATGKQTVSAGITITKFADGKAIESWNNWDRLGLMQQIGVVPEMGKKGE